MSNNQTDDLARLALFGTEPVRTILKVVTRAVETNLGKVSIVQFMPTDAFDWLQSVMPYTNRLSKLAVAFPFYTVIYDAQDSSVKELQGIFTWVSGNRQGNEREQQWVDFDLLYSQYQAQNLLELRTLALST